MESYSLEYLKLKVMKQKSKTINSLYKVNIKDLAFFITSVVREIQYEYERLGVRCLNNNQFHFMSSYDRYLRDLAIILRNHSIKKTAKIVDAGCGVSPILIFLSILGYTNLTGIEIHKFYLYKLKQFLFGANLIHGDIFEQTYESYDVIYSYMPISNPTMCKKFYKKVLETMKPGAILVDFMGPLDSLGLSRIKGKFEYRCATSEGRYIIKL